jgi:hypothetical protein
MIHKGKKYGGEEEKSDDDEDAPKAKKAKKESIDPEAFAAKFGKMVEAKKDPKKKTMKEAAKPDFLDIDGDGDRKEPMKKAAADKKKKTVKEVSDKTVGSLLQKRKDNEASANKGHNSDAAFDATGKRTGAYGASIKRNKRLGRDPYEHPKAESVRSSKKVVKESVEPKLTFKDMVKLVQESGGQQAIDPVDTALFAWAQRVAANKFTESTKAELYRWIDLRTQWWHIRNV